MSEKNSQLCEAVIKRDVVEVTRLLEAGADPNEFYSRGLYWDETNPIIVADTNKDVEMVELLRKYGGNLEASLMEQSRILGVFYMWESRTYPYRTHPVTINLGSVEGSNYLVKTFNEMMSKGYDKGDIKEIIKMLYKMGARPGHPDRTVKVEIPDISEAVDFVTTHLTSRHRGIQLMVLLMLEDETVRQKAQNAIRLTIFERLCVGEFTTELVKKLMNEL